MTTPTTDSHRTLKHLSDRLKDVAYDGKVAQDEWRRFKIVEDEELIPEKVIKDQRDPIKASGLDKQFGDERYFGRDPLFDPDFGNPSPQPSRESLNMRRPFVLRTPHHIPEWEMAGGSEAARHDIELAEYERVISQLEDARKRGERRLEILDQELESLRDEYEELLKEYEQGEDKGEAE